MKLERYCTCGAVLKTTVERRRKAQALSVWASSHSGEGHAETTADEAERVRMGASVAYGREAKRKEHTNGA